MKLQRMDPYKKYCCCVLYTLLFFVVFAQGQHPHILVKPADKTGILQKMEQQIWARQLYDEMVKNVSVYVERHSKDPEWILSRYLMNRTPGKRYTQFFSDPDGTALVRYAGDAPFPTVRVSPHKRPPVSKDGYAYKMPSIEDLLPYDTGMKMWLTSEAPGASKEYIDPQSFVEALNRKINTLALDAAILYWLSGQENMRGLPQTY